MRLFLSFLLLLSLTNSLDAEQPLPSHGQEKTVSDKTQTRVSPQTPGNFTKSLQCSIFKWIPAQGISDQAAILIPISLDGKDYWYQLDTGADVTIPYGELKNPGWTHQGNTVRIPHVSFGGMSFSAIRAYPKTDTQPDAEVQGTVGLDILIGHAAVFDFPHQRFCLVESADIPEDLLQNADWASAEIRHGKLFVDMELNGRKLDQIFYDTGSSVSALDVDLALWKDFTGKTGSSDATAHFRAPSWGKEIEIIGAPASGDLKIGKHIFPHPQITTFPAQPASYSADYQAQGLLGNALFRDKVIILDLGAHPAFGIVNTTP
jgi:hypothetical protein